MTLDIALVLLILVGSIILFASEKIRVDLVALLVLLTLLLTGLITPEEAFSGFASPAVITVWAIYMVSASLTHTGIADYIGRYIERMGGNGEGRLIFVLMGTVGMMSAFMNNIGAAAVLLPVSIVLGEKARIPVSKLLIPLAFGSLLGGITTLIGTPPNLLASDALAQAGFQPFSLFDYSPMGVIILFSGIAYMVFIGRHLLPGDKRITHTHTKSAELTREYRLWDNLLELEVLENSPLIGKTLVETNLGEFYDFTVLGVLRNGRLRLGVLPNAHIQAGDVLIVKGIHNDVPQLEREILVQELTETVRDKNLRTAEATLAELVVSQKAHFIGQTLRQMEFRNRYGLTVLGLWREESPINEHVADVPLQLGDSLLVQGRRERIEAVREDDALLLLREPEKLNRRLSKAPVNLLIFVVMISLVATGVLHISVAAVLGAVLSVLFGCMTMDEAYDSVQWKSVFLIAGMLPMGIAMETSGTAQFLADFIINLVGSYGAGAIMIGLFVLTTILTAFMSNAAAIVLVAPIAIQTAVSLQVDPRAFVMGVAIAASIAFVTPIGHQACILVYGPGGYRFFDYAKVGLPLTILIWILMVIFLPLFWPLAM
ncbi:MAG: SLC13 family permease [Anaerolineae bacterium]|nr:SLC13 family permease [Anaerolineae bacterium]